MRARRRLNPIRRAPSYSFRLVDLLREKKTFNLQFHAAQDGLNGEGKGRRESLRGIRRKNPQHGNANNESYFPILCTPRIAYKTWRLRHDVFFFLKVKRNIELFIGKKITTRQVYREYLLFGARARIFFFLLPRAKTASPRIFAPRIIIEFPRVEKKKMEIRKTPGTRVFKL